MTALVVYVATDEERDEQEQLQMEAVQLSYTRLRESP